MEPEKKHFAKVPPFVWFLGGLAAVIMIAGLLYPVVFCEINTRDTTYISALFSLTGVFIFAAALVYQIKEYSLQADELKKSVEAQMSSSKTMEAQRHEMEEQRKVMERQQQLLVDQNTNTFIFNLIENFNAFKRKENILTNVDGFKIYYQNLVEKIRKAQYNPPYIDAWKVFSEDTIYSFTNWFTTYRQNRHLLNYWNFATIVFNFLEEKRAESLSYSIYLPIFHNQFSDHEKLLLVLLNTYGEGTNYTSELSWRNHHLDYLIDRVYSIYNFPFIAVLERNSVLNQLNEIASKRKLELKAL